MRGTMVTVGFLPLPLSLHGKSDLNSLDTTDLQKAHLPPHPPLCVPDASFPFAEIGTPVQCSRPGWALC